MHKLFHRVRFIRITNAHVKYVDSFSNRKHGESNIAKLKKKNIELWFYVCVL